MKKIEFFVPGKPEPAGSKRAFVLRKGGQWTGRAIVTDDNPKSKSWQGVVRQIATDAYSEAPLEGPLCLVVEFLVARPKGHYRAGKNAHLLRENAPVAPITKPDATKLLRGLEDALTGILWRDDAQIVRQIVTKRFADTTPGALVSVMEWEDWQP